ncbi:AP endonuclease 1 [Kipferlia bialata]|uniref:DNA repair nuclease/redox regulator APEX1 n=1 Tax=Kipferlia bialata TaxID=797122 RepID=A0A9K3CV63_9EUKA|nr:AP endonuclease 1 [Kipferlia bialata]|eukprot:g5299.t1
MAGAKKATGTKKTTSKRGVSKKKKSAFPIVRVSASAPPCPSTSTDPVLSVVALNVNGIRAALGKKCQGQTLAEWVAQEKPDVFFMGETKLGTSAFDKYAAEYCVDGNSPFKGYVGHYCLPAPPTRQGYAGSCVFIRSGVAYTAVTHGLGVEEHDTEGRFCTVETPSGYLCHAYVPNAGRGAKSGQKGEALPNLHYRIAGWEETVRSHIACLRLMKPVIYIGDMNVCHQPMDIHDFKANRGKPGVTDQERHAMTNLISDGMIDSFRHLYPDEVKFSWFSNFSSSRAMKRGWRLDYVLVDSNLLGKVKDSEIFDDHRDWSDHVPVRLTLTE